MWDGFDRDDHASVRGLDYYNNAFHPYICMIFIFAIPWKLKLTDEVVCVLPSLLKTLWYWKQQQQKNKTNNPLTPTLLKSSKLFENSLIYLNIMQEYDVNCQKGKMRFKYILQFF